MYEKVRPARVRKCDWHLFLAIAACTLILVITALPIVFAGNYQHQYRMFQESLANSTIYSRHNNSLTMELDGEVISLDADGGYHTLLLSLVTAGAGRVGKPPAEPAEVKINFGNGASLELWGVELTDYVDPNSGYGLFLRYTYPDGKTYAYDTHMLTIEKALIMLKNK